MFFPSASNGALARMGVLSRLSESLTHIVEQCRDQLTFDSGACEALVQSLRRGEPQKPELFARYFELVDAVQEGDADTAEQLLAAIAAQPPKVAKAPLIRDFNATDLGAAEIGLILRHMRPEGIDGASLAQVTKEEAKARHEQVRNGLERIRRYVPELSDEIDETIAELILARGVHRPSGYSFDGISSLAYWGGILLNIAISKTDLQVVEMIAHEAAHNVLFGLSPTEFFVTNPESELHASPLRDDPRPLDGIYHAAFVLTRMHYAVERLKAAGGLADGEDAEADRLLADSSQNFRDAHAVLEANANYTAKGRAIMAECASYMNIRGPAA